jgi:hypothetical protein
MLLVISRYADPNLDDSTVVAVYEFETQEKLDAWLSRFEQVVEPTFKFDMLETSELVELPSYDDPASEWERPDYVRLVKRLLDSRVLCWHCNSERITVVSDGWICMNCGQSGAPKSPNDELPIDFQQGCVRNLPYRDFKLTNAQKAWDFARPYVCVVHRPTGKGYYLDRGYSLIGSVNNIVTPPRDGGSVDSDLPYTLTRCLPHKTIDDMAASFSTPEWAVKLPSKEFTSFWLY